MTLNSDWPERTPCARRCVRRVIGTVQPSQQPQEVRSIIICPCSRWGNQGVEVKQLVQSQHRWSAVGDSNLWMFGLRADPHISVPLKVGSPQLIVWRVQISF